MKKIISFIIAAALLCTCVFAAELPHEFWALNDWYTNAKNSGDYRGIIDSSLQTLELLNSVPETEQTVNIKASRTEQAALAYEATGDYDSSADMFTKYAQYAKRLGWDDAVKIAGAKALQYKTDIRLYRETLRPVSYFGARLEPAVGTYFGLAAASEKIESVPRASSLLLYLEFGERENGWFEKTLKRAQDEGRAVVFAWNMPGEGSQIAATASQDAYVNEILSTIEDIVQRKFSALLVQDFSNAGGVESLANILNCCDRGTEKNIMEWLDIENQQMAQEVRDLMFVFEDIIILDDRAIQRLLREVDTKQLALALKGTKEEIKDKVFKNMSERARQMLSDDMEYLGPVRAKEVQEAQTGIVNAIRNLEATGEITITRASVEDELIE